MLPDRRFLGQLLREALIGAVLGFIIFGVGGRLVMRLIAAQSGAAPILTTGGTITVLVSGVMAGAGGALLHAVARAIMWRVAPGHTSVRITVFGLLLVLITWRGLRGSPTEGAVWFWPLVALYWATFLFAIRYFAFGFRRKGADGPIVLYECPLPVATSSHTMPLTIRGSRGAIEKFIPRDEFGSLFGGYAMWRMAAEPTAEMPDEAIGVWSRRTCSRFRRILRERGATIDVREERGPEQQISQWNTSSRTLSRRDWRKLLTSKRKTEAAP